MTAALDHYGRDRERWIDDQAKDRSIVYSIANRSQRGAVNNRVGSLNGSLHQAGGRLDAVWIAGRSKNIKLFVAVAVLVYFKNAPIARIIGGGKDRGPVKKTSRPHGQSGHRRTAISRNLAVAKIVHHLEIIAVGIQSKNSAHSRCPARFGGAKEKIICGLDQLAHGVGPVSPDERMQVRVTASVLVDFKNFLHGCPVKCPVMSLQQRCFCGAGARVGQHLETIAICVQRKDGSQVAYSI